MTTSNIGFLSKRQSLFRPCRHLNVLSHIYKNSLDFGGLSATSLSRETWFGEILHSGSFAQNYFQIDKINSRNTYSLKFFFLTLFFFNHNSSAIQRNYELSKCSSFWKFIFKFPKIFNIYNKLIYSGKCQMYLKVILRMHE